MYLGIVFSGLEKVKAIMMIINPSEKKIRPNDIQIEKFSNKKYRDTAIMQQITNINIDTPKSIKAQFNQAITND